ncbi:MAG TPA: acetylornithine deacetylase [Chromatiales bacterium]|nr:acetylornithine deacetylase [Chromatiales bacterium]
MTLPDTLELIRRLVRIPSVSSASPERDMSNRAVVDQLAEWLEALGWSVHVTPIAGRDDKVNLVARLGAGKDGLVLAGHTDTVPWDEGLWHFDPLDVTEREGRLYGLGTADMKGFLALVVDALRDLDAAHLSRPVVVLATADEETSMAGAHALREPLGRYCLVGEPTGLVPVHRHKGILMEAITLHGRAGHSSDPAAGNSALEGMVALAQELLAYRDELQQTWHDSTFSVPEPTLNLGRIQGGDSPNRICARCELELDLRLLPGMDPGRLRRALRERARCIAEQRGLQIDFTALFEGIPALETPRGSAFLGLVESLSGHRAATAAFGTEGPFYQALGMETVVCGPGAIAQAHRPDEFLDWRQARQASELIRRLVHTLCGRGAGDDRPQESSSV